MENLQINKSRASACERKVDWFDAKTNTTWNAQQQRIAQTVWYSSFDYNHSLVRTETLIV